MVRQLTLTATVLALLAASLIVVVAAQEPPEPPTTANVEVRVWQSTRDAERLYISARPAGGSWDTIGTIPLDMSSLNSRGTYRYADIAVGVPLVQVEPEPEPTAVASSITVTLRTSSTEQPVLIPSVETDQTIPRNGLLMGLSAKGRWLAAYNAREIPANEEFDALERFPDLDWQAVDEVEIRTRDGNRISLWECESTHDRHSFEGSYSCSIEATHEAPSLKAVDDPALWVYVVNSSRNDYLDVHLRAGSERVGHVSVGIEVDNPEACSDFGTHPARPLFAGHTQDLGCRSFIPGWSASGPENGPRHSEVTQLYVVATALGVMRCERHQDSTEARSVWACATWAE